VASETPEPDLLALSWIESMGATIVHGERGDARVRAEPRRHNLNHNDTWAGPVLLGLCEFAVGVAVLIGSGSLVHTAFVVVSEASIAYRRPARGVLDVVVVTDPRGLPEHPGAFERWVTATVLDADEQVCATAEIHIELRERR
jgi:acyl-coenzyme A thioesterase PaaI-like protein